MFFATYLLAAHPGDAAGGLSWTEALQMLAFPMC